MVASPNEKDGFGSPPPKLKLGVGAAAGAVVAGVAPKGAGAAPPPPKLKAGLTGSAGFGGGAVVAPKLKLDADCVTVGGFSAVLLPNENDD